MCCVGSVQIQVEIEKGWCTADIDISDEGPTLEMLDFTIRVGSTPTFLIEFTL